MMDRTEGGVTAFAAPAARPSPRSVEVFLATLFATACADSPSTLAPASPDAERIASLWWILLAICGVIYIVFACVALFAMLRRQRAPVDAEASEGTSARWVVLAGAVLPAVIVAGLIVVTLGAMRDLSAREDARVVIEVHGRLWWWELRYLDGQGNVAAITANEIHIPVGEPVELRLISDNVIHSFWVPRLHGKLDLIPGKANVLTVQADRAGEYRGFCAEYCGLQHAHMGFLVIASARAEFDAWLAREAAPAVPATTPALAQGQSAFATNCGTCHTVRGNEAQGTEGPDLTHLASRRTLAAATLANNTGNLGGWMVRAQSIKPGSLMPNVDLEAQELLDILTYLASLR